MSLGFEQAGFDIVAAVEVDPVHAATHHFNFPNTAVIPRSVVGLTGHAIRTAAGLGQEAVDVVFGGPPCQGFSLMGHRMLDDDRNRLVREFVRLVEELEARAFVFENVKGLTIGRHRMFLEALVEAFDEAGYHVRIPWRVLNAVHFGVPQDRERLFLLGARKDGLLPVYPEPVTVPGNDLLTRTGVRPTPTCQEALEDLPDAERWEELLIGDSVRATSPKARSAYARELRCEGPESWHAGYRRVWDPDMLTSSMRSRHTPISRERFTATPEGEIEPISRFFKLARSGVCNTLRAGTDAARGAFTSPRPIHYAFPRCVTVREMARLHGYPDWFRFHVTKWHGARQVGNSVPPPLARAVAAKVREGFGQASVVPDASLDLGDPSLLSMDIGQAADFWGVPRPSGRRDRKSGQKKRRQEEIGITGRLAQRKVS